ncbi:SMC-Scp complex subunit ScpB, partial [Wenyingzhuangia sp. 1_MG-2023]|nr:SMC-Scp complex subunit ScpB [Wenyingzhuangia sp. 1_MG-2023]
IELVKVASGYRLQVRQHTMPWVSRLWQERPPRYTRALLETLVLIAYRHPVTRGDIEDVRGVVVSSGIIKTLLEREWI